MSAVMDRPATRCEHRGCDRPATYIVHWPSVQIMAMCQGHAAEARRMGFSVEEVK